MFRIRLTVRKADKEFVHHALSLTRVGVIAEMLWQISYYDDQMVNGLLAALASAKEMEPIRYQAGELACSLMVTVAVLAIHEWSEPVLVPINANSVEFRGTPGNVKMESSWSDQWGKSKAQPEQPEQPAESESAESEAEKLKHQAEWLCFGTEVHARYTDFPVWRPLSHGFVAVPYNSVTLNGFPMLSIQTEKEPYAGSWAVISPKFNKALDGEDNSRPYRYASLQGAIDDVQRIVGNGGEHSVCP